MRRKESRLKERPGTNQLEAEWQTAEAREVAKVAGRKIIDAALEIVLEVAGRHRFRQR